MTSFDPAVFRDPAVVGELFMIALRDPNENANTLDFLVTPESRPRWGYFEAAYRWTQGIEGLGWGNMPLPAVGDPDVVYMAVHSGVPEEGFTQEGDDIFLGPGVVTMVWRPEVDRWMVHDIGNYVRPEEVPRGPS